MQKWEYFSKEELQDIVQNSYSFAEIARKIEYNDKTGSYHIAINNMIQHYQFNISHLLGQGWNKDNYDFSRMKNGSVIKSSILKNMLIYKRGYRCENCGNSEWGDTQIPLEVHHIDGDSLNNEIDNLQLLCPNCHSITSNWRKPNSKYVTDEEFIKALRENNNIRQALLSLELSAKGANYERAYNLIEKYKIKMKNT